MKIHLWPHILMTILLVGCAKGDSPSEQRRGIQQMRQQTLSTFYKQNSAIKREVAKAKGYAVFTNINNNILVISTGTGYGVLRDNRNGRDTYMNMASAGLGVGFGIKQFQALIIFNDASALNQFISTGFDANVQADLAAKIADDGVIVASEAANANFQKVKVYHMTEQGVALQATVQGYKYWPDGDLNKKVVVLNE